MVIDRVRIYYPNGEKDLYLGDHYGDEEIIEFNFNEEHHRLEIFTKVGIGKVRKIKLQGLPLEVFSAPYEK